jgi:hypothetical protein
MCHAAVRTAPAAPGTTVASRSAISATVSEAGSQTPTSAAVLRALVQARRTLAAAVDARWRRRTPRRPSAVGTATR